jgi:hypothetical protein
MEAYGALGDKTCLNFVADKELDPKNKFRKATFIIKNRLQPDPI